MKNEKLEKDLIKYEKKEEYQKLNRGTQNVLRFYYNSKDKRNISGILIVDDIVWDNDFKDFVSALKSYDVNELVFGSTWSSAIELEMYLIENGYEVVGTTKYYEDDCFGRKEIKKGIKMVWNKSSKDM